MVKSSTRPDVSVIIPTYRREREVLEAVESVLSQTSVRVECFVVDDTAEATARAGVEEIQDARVRYVARAEPTGGKPAIVRNEGAELATGRYLHFLDDDDKLADGALASMVQALDARPERGVAVGWVVPFGDDPSWLKDKRTYFSWAAQVGAQTPSSLWTAAHILFRGTLMVNSACMIRRPLFELLGGYDPGIQVYEDVDFYMRAIRRFGHVYVDRPILHYRVGKPSLMHNLGMVNSETGSSNAIMHQKYRQEHGMLEYRFLQACMKLLPFAVTRRIPLGG